MFYITLFEDTNKEKYEKNKSYSRLIIGSDDWTNAREGIMIKDKDGNYVPGWSQVPGVINKPINFVTTDEKFDEIIFVTQVDPKKMGNDITMYGHLRGRGKN